MNPHLLKYYNQELQYIREMGAEFASEYPKIAGRLGLDGFDCVDPYVERLLEGFAFLTARIQLKLDAQFPQFTQYLLQTVYPHYLSQTPSMTVVQFQPDYNESGLSDGITLPRDSILRSLLGKNEQTACLYRTAHDVTLWPIKINQAEYLTTMAGSGLPEKPGTRAALRLQLVTSNGQAFNQLPLDELSFYLPGTDAMPMHIYEQLFANTLSVVVRSPERSADWHRILPKEAICQEGFDDKHALLPLSQKSFSGYRLLHEYFAFPARFMFMRLTQLADAVSHCSSDRLEVIFLFDRQDSYLEKHVSTDNFSLFCSPAINLFSKQCDRIHVTPGAPELHVVADKTRPMDFEVHSIQQVQGYGAEAGSEQTFQPFYGSNNLAALTPQQAFYIARREPRQLSTRQQHNGPRSSYIGSETYISLVDFAETPYRDDLRQVGVQALCSNRDLPLHMPVGKENTDFTLDSGAPLNAVRCIAGPSKPLPSWAQNESCWRLISHLSLNYLSLTDNDEQKGALALRELLALYGDIAELSVRKQIEGVCHITSKAVIRRIPVSGPIALGRGQEIALTLDEDAFVGSGVFLLGAVMERFFARYASINAFTQTVIRTRERGEIMRWPLRTGSRHVL